MTAVLAIMGLGACAAGLIWWILRNLDRALTQIELERHAKNDRIRALYAREPNSWYPHEMADGEVRWYRVDDDASVRL